jgi:hypothetical protein
MNKRKSADGEDHPPAKRFVGDASALFNIGPSLIYDGEESMQIEALPLPHQRCQEVTASSTASSGHRQPVTLLMAMSMSEKSGWEALPKRSRRRDRDNAMHD